MNAFNTLTDVKTIDINLNRMNHHYFCVHPTSVIKGLYTVNSKSQGMCLVSPEIALKNLSSGIEVTDFYLATGRLNVSNEFVIPVTHGFDAEDEERAVFFADVIKDGRERWIKYYQTNKTSGGYCYRIGGLVKGSASGQRLWSNLTLADVIVNTFNGRTIVSQEDFDNL